MDVEDGLSSRFAHVHDETVAIGLQVKRAGNLCGPHDHSARRQRIGFGQLVEAGDVLSRNDENVNGRLWIDVVECDDILVLVRFPGGDVAGDDSAEQTTVIGCHGAIIRRRDRSPRDPAPAPRPYTLHLQPRSEPAAADRTRSP